MPEALLRGAQLVTAANVEAVEVVAGRARGVRGALGGGGANGRRFHVKADAVVVAGGTLMTPLLLARGGVVRHPWLGKNLSIHPATKVMAVFDEDIDMSRGIPQGYAIDTFAEEGIMFEGASTPLDVTAIAVPWVGRRLMDVMEAYRRVATFGFMVKDTSRGTVRAGPGGAPFLTYNLNARRHAVEDAPRDRDPLRGLSGGGREARAPVPLRLGRGADESATSRAAARRRCPRRRSK